MFRAQFYAAFVRTVPTEPTVAERVFRSVRAFASEKMADESQILPFLGCVLSPDKQFARFYTLGRLPFRWSRDYVNSRAVCSTI